MKSYRQYLNENLVDQKLEEVRSKIIDDLVDRNLSAAPDMYIGLYKDSVDKEKHEPFDMRDVVKYCKDQYKEYDLEGIFKEYVEVTEERIPILTVRDLITIFESIPRAMKMLKNPTEDFKFKEIVELIKYNIELVQYMRNVPVQIQEYVIKNRPDLINKIQNLDPGLAKEYKYELGLSGIEI
jgi:hypothetical protein